MAEVEIFWAQMCGLCHKTMDYFKEKEIKFDSYEVQWDGDKWVDSENSRKMIERCGNVDFVPQIFIKGKHIKGWKSLEPMIESGEIENLLKK